MRLLIINFEVDEDSPVLAWQAKAARALARRCESVLVLTHKIGRFEPAPNLTVTTFDEVLPPDSWRVARSLPLNARVRRLCAQHRIQVCFIHMAHQWAFRLYPALRLAGVPILLWYAHGSVSPGLRLALRCATRVITSTPEGFRIPSPKVRIIGQGVDTELFSLLPSPTAPRDLVYVGRVSRRKRIDLLIDVMRELRSRAPERSLRLRIIGPMLTPDDLTYDVALRSRVWDLGLASHIEFTGFVPQRYVPALYENAFVHINVSQTGSMDKTVVESLAMGCPVLTSNEAFAGLLSQRPGYVIRDDSPAAIASQVLEVLGQHDSLDRHELRAMVVGHHDADSYIDKVHAQLQEIL